MLDMGFRPAVDRIVGACPRDRQTLFFSATLDGDAGRLASRYTHDARRHDHSPRQSRTAKVEHRFVAVDRDSRMDALVGELRGERDRALVFVRTKRGADRLVNRLGHAGVDAVAMHGDKSQRQREKALARFEAGTVDTLVATDVAARGIDVEGISHVINFDPPADRDGYVHRVGRTGRAGRERHRRHLLRPRAGEGHRAGSRPTSACGASSTRPSARPRRRRSRRAQPSVTRGA